MIKHAAIAADLRQRINPAYATQRGTESYERRECAESIEELITTNAELLEALRKAIDTTYSDKLQSEWIALISKVTGEMK